MITKVCPRNFPTIAFRIIGGKLFSDTSKENIGKLQRESIKPSVYYSENPNKIEFTESLSK